MTNQSTDSHVGRRRRYTVSRLLELAPHTRGIHFDLSKFTYDAARAGVVPPLGACVMSTRRTLSDQPRNWSQESSSSQEDLIVYRGSRIVKDPNRIVEQPDRQPKGPPTNDQDEGFARFLKKHSSPTHQRVTAGGRIVPMEHRPRPPACQLVNCNQYPESERKINAREGSARNNQGTKLDIASPVERKPEPLEMHPTQSQLQAPVTNTLMDNNVLSAGINMNLVSAGDVLNVDTTTAQSNWMAPILPAPVGPSMFPDPYYLPSPQLYPNCAMPLTPPLPGYNGTLEGQYPMPLVPFPDLMMGLPALGETLMTTGDLSPPGTLSLEHLVTEARARFEELDRQLKMLDRHRAITTRDPLLSEHRMAVVMMRARAKSDMSYWAHVASEAKAAKPSVGASGRAFNVEAAAYVPLRSNSLVNASSSQSINVSEDGDNTGRSTKPKPLPKAGRRGIPIMPPPETLDSPVKKLTNTTPAQSPSVAVDEWGVRIGEAPPEILRQQEEMAKTLLQEANKSPQKAAGDVPVESPVASHNTSPLHDQAIELTPDEKNEDGEKNSQNGEWLPTKPGRAPSTVEACYELQLNAMRLPKGTISKIRMPDGTITEVQGQGLQRPPSLGMDEFERRYWKAKPVLTKEMTSQFLEVRVCSESPAATTVLDHLDSNRLVVESSHTTPVKQNATKVLLSGSSGSSSGFANHLKEAGKELLPTPSHGREHDHRGYHSATFGSNGSEPSMLTFKQSSASSTPLCLRGDERAGWFASEPSQETALNKGYSSVSVQNVHAIGRLPHMLDGTADSQRRSAKLMLSVAGKAPSPQRGRSATTASDALRSSRRADRGPVAESDTGGQVPVIGQKEM